MSSRRSHLEWIQAYQSGRLPESPYMPGTGTGRPLPTNSPVTNSANGGAHSGSPTLRSLLVGGSSNPADDRNTASGFLRSIVQNMLTQKSDSGRAPASSPVRAPAISSTETTRGGSGASPASRGATSMLASFLYGAGSKGGAATATATAEPIQVKTEPPDDYESSMTLDGNMVPTSTTGSSPSMEVSPSNPAMVRVKDEPLEESSPDPHDPEWNPDSHSSGSSPLSGIGQPAAAPSTVRNSRKGNNPKKRILGNFLQMKEEELQLAARAGQQARSSAVESQHPNLMLSLLKEPIRTGASVVTPAATVSPAPARAPGGRRAAVKPTRSVATRSSKSQVQAQQLASRSENDSQGLRVIYVDKNDGKTYKNKYVQCHLLVNDMSHTDVGKAFGENYVSKSSFASAPCSGLESQGVVVGEAQEGQMGRHLHSVQCPHCNITFDDEVMYSIHMGCHSHKDPFLCNVCGKHCSHKYEFYTHIVRGHQVDES